MSRTESTKLGLHDRQRIFSSPVAIAFVRIVVARRGVTEAKARQIYLDYLNRSQAPADRRLRENA
jgi:hypothetical protein